MMPKAEALDLQTNPLPVTDLDKFIPSQIANIDSEIALLNEKIKELGVQRGELLDRAKETGVLEDPYYRIEHWVTSIRALNLTKFRVYFPEEYEQIVALQEKQAINKAKSMIPLATAERFVAKRVLVGKPVFDLTTRESWHIVKKDVV